MYCTVNPLLVWENTGINSYMLASRKQSIEMSYYFLLEALKTQKPKVVAIEVYMTGLEDFAKEEGTIRDALDGLPLSINKLNMINNITESNQEEYYIDFLKYHSRWKELEDNDFDIKITKPHDLRGYHYFYKVTKLDIDKELMANKDKVDTIEVGGEDLIYLNKIIELTKENDIKLLLLFAPMQVTENDIQRLNGVKKFANDNSIPLIDCIDLWDRLNINENEDFYDDGHLNYKGTTKTTNYISDFLTNNYTFSKQYSEDTINGLNEDLRNYKKRVGI